MTTIFSSGKRGGLGANLVSVLICWTIFLTGRDCNQNSNGDERQHTSGMTVSAGLLGDTLRDRLTDTIEPSGNDLFTAYGMFYVTVNSNAREFYTLTRDVGDEIHVIKSKSNSHGYCNGAACHGEEKDVAIIGQRTQIGDQNGFKLTLAADSFSDIYITCPFGVMTPQMTALYCTVNPEESRLEDVGVGIESFGPFIRTINTVNCGSDSVTFTVAEFTCLAPSDEAWRPIRNALLLPRARQLQSFGFENRPVTRRKILIDMDADIRYVWVDGNDYRFEAVHSNSELEGWCSTTLCYGFVSAYVHGPNNRQENTVVLNSDAAFFNNDIRVACPYGDQNPVVTVLTCNSGEQTANPVIIGPLIQAFGLDCLDGLAAVRIDCVDPE